MFFVRGHCEVSVVVASLLDGRDRAVEERGGGGSEARRSFHTIVFFHVLYYQNPFKCPKQPLVLVYSFGVARKVFYFNKNRDERSVPWSGTTCEIPLIG